MRTRSLLLAALGLVVVGAVAVGVLVMPGRSRAQSVPGSCGDASAPYAEVQIDGYPRLDLELARTPQEQQIGLMYREYLPPDSGMLFVYTSESNEPYWMYHTLLPLSIAFIDRSSTIVDIKDMTRLDDPDDIRAAARNIYPSAAPYWYALEVNQGWFADHGVEVGQQVLLCLGA